MTSNLINYYNLAEKYLSETDWVEKSLILVEIRYLFKSLSKEEIEFIKFFE